ncbi:hypothetical protein PmP19_22 [Proteus phage PmP19]|uniref:Uncharacterized protein n=2 Tax=Gansuvirus TaxID=3424934 RepID=A0A7S9XFT5_9CAUD|nr:hypothetical protein PmP19_22 [Proteus phage PmP19]CAK6604978.1 unknown function [Klebsiella phage vB_Kpn_K22PH164C1]
MSIVNKAFKAVGIASKTPTLETKVPAQQLERQAEVGADSVNIGADDSNSVGGKGKRSLVRPVASSLGV